MSWKIETPGQPSGDADRKIDQIFRYLYRIAGQINYALGFLPLPGLSQSGTEQTEDDRISAISEKSTNAQIPSAGAVFRFVRRFAVPQERKVNGQPLTEDVTLSAGDLDALPTEAVVQEITEDATADTVPSAAAVMAHTEGAIRIIDSGTDGAWVWDKYSDGTAILHGHAVPATISEPSEWVTDWATGTCTITLPNLFSNARYTTIVDLHGAILIGSQNVSSNLLAISFAVPAALYPDNMTIDAIIHGEWEE